MIAVQMVAIALFVPTAMLNKVTEIEYRWLDSAYTTETVQDLYSKTNFIHKAVTRDTGLAEWIEWMFLPPKEARVSPKPGMASIGQNFWFPYLESRGRALDEMVWITIMRVVSVSAWLPLLLLLAIPTLVDGIMERRIKQHTFKYASPFLYRHALRMVVVVGVIMFFCILSPIPIHPYMLPAGLAAVILVSGIVVLGNLPKRV